MKILLLNTYDSKGGAAIASTRLWNGLHQAGIEATYLVQEKFASDPNIIGPENNFKKGWGILRPHIDRFPLLFYPNREKTFWSVQWLSGDIIERINAINPDVVHLHWICNGFVPIQALSKIKRPIVWTLHDSWAFTGGCHVPQDCEKFKTHCQQCPQLNSDKKKDLSYRTFNKKQKYWQNLNLQLVAPSHWLANNIKSSTILGSFPVSIVHNGLDLSVFKPIHKSTAREILNLPTDKKLILFGALNPTSDPNKGFHLLQKALRKVATQLSFNTELVIFGTSEPTDSPDLGMKAHYMGWLNDNISLSILYAACDVMVVPSLQEVFPTTAVESAACGTPVVAFDATGLKDIIAHKVSGYLANPYDADDLGNGILWVLSDKERHTQLGLNARNAAVAKFGIQHMAANYISVYQSLLV